MPVINALSDREHPCQALADLLTLRERFSTLRGLKVAYLGEGNNVARALAYASVLVGMELRCASPEGYALSDADIDRAHAAPGSGRVECFSDPRAAVAGAAAVYTDVWASMATRTSCRAASMRSRGSASTRRCSSPRRRTCW